MKLHTFACALLWGCAGAPPPAPSAQPVESVEAPAPETSQPAAPEPAPIDEKSLLGRWRGVDCPGETRAPDATVFWEKEFRDGGVAFNVSWIGGNRDGTEKTNEGKWKLQGNVLTEAFPAPPDGTAFPSDLTIDALDERRLHVRNEDGTLFCYERMEEGAAAP